MKLAFKSWLTYVLRRRDRIIADVNNMMGRVTHKHDVELLTSVAHAKKPHKVYDNTVWKESINREMETLKVAFGIMEAGTKIPVNHAKASGHLVF